MTDAKLDPAEVEALWTRHAAGIRWFVLGVLRDAELAEEVLQQTFVTALERGQDAAAATRKGWLFKVAFSHAMELKRRRATGARVLGTLRDALRVGSGAPNPGPVDSALRDETVERIRRAVRALPDAQRRVVEMRMHESKTFAEIAAELGVPLSTALTRMRLATAKLRSALEETEP